MSLCCSRYQCICDYPYSGDDCELYDELGLLEAIQPSKLALISVYAFSVLAFYFSCMILTTLRWREIRLGEKLVSGSWHKQNRICLPFQNSQSEEMECLSGMPLVSGQGQGGLITPRPILFNSLELRNYRWTELCVWLTADCCTENLKQASQISIYIQFNGNLLRPTVYTFIYDSPSTFITIKGVVW